MSGNDGLIWAYRVDDGGQARAVEWDSLDAPETGFCWAHLDLEAAPATRWLREKSGLSEIECSALLAEETRPRATLMRDGLVLILRGVNLNPGADPEDMVSVRMWVEADRVITVRRRRLLALEDVRERFAEGRGASNVGEFVSELADRLVERMSGVIGGLDERLDHLEEGDQSGDERETRRKLAGLRRESIALRRHLAPQRDALARLCTERLPWLGDLARLALREALDRTTRYVEDLEATRERAAVAQDELASRLSEQLNRRMYALSVVAGVFLPLSFVTGLLGINVGGIPGADTGWGFAAVSASLVLLALGEIALFRRVGWL